MMRVLRKGHIGYSGTIDVEVAELVDAMNCMPGIYTSESCSGHGESPVHIFFSVRPANGQHQMGLFFLTRCVDRRYWEYGHKWHIELSVGDTYNRYLPVTYLLRSESVGEEAYNEVRSLLENFKDHLNHENFIKLYHLDLELFETEEI